MTAEPRSGAGIVPRSGGGAARISKTALAAATPLAEAWKWRPPQRLVHLRRDHDDQKGGGQVHMTEQQAEAHLHRDDRHRQRGDELQDRTGQEGDPEGVHGGGAVGPSQLADALRRPGLPAEGLEGRQPGEQVEHLTAQALHGLQTLLRVALGESSDEDHEDGDERYGARHGDGGKQVLREHDQSGQGGDRGGEEELGQVPGEVRFEVVQAPCQQGGGPGAVLGRPARSQRGGVLQDLAAQFDDRACGGAVGEKLLRVEDADACRHGERQQPDEGRDRAERGTGGDDGRDGPRDENGLRDDEQGRRTAGQGGDDDVAPGGVRVTHEPGVQRLHRSRIVVLGLWS